LLGRTGFGHGILLLSSFGFVVCVRSSVVSEGPNRLLSSKSYASVDYQNTNKYRNIIFVAFTIRAGSITTYLAFAEWT
jgi:hypothetical protein